MGCGLCCNFLLEPASFKKSFTLNPRCAKVKVNVAPATPPDPALRASIDNIENERSEKEATNVFESVGLIMLRSICLVAPFLDEALAEVKALTDFILSELEVRRAGCLFWVLWFQLLGMGAALLEGKSS
jgi:hypothetical protein